MPHLNLVFTEAASSDIDSILKWYGLLSSEKAHEFSADLNATFALIARNPRLGRKITSKKRGRLLANYPYKIIYQVNRREIFVRGVVHTARGPSVVRSR